MGWVSFAESVGVTSLATILAPCWHILVRNDKPEPQELAIGIDLMVATMVLLFGFLPGSRGAELVVRLAGLVVLFLLLTGLGVITKMWGYKPSRPVLYRREVSEGGQRRYIEVPRQSLTGVVAWTTSMAGSAVLCLFWWLNLNTGFVVAAWKGVFH